MYCCSMVQIFRKLKERNFSVLWRKWFSIRKSANCSVEIHFYMQITPEEETWIFMHTVFHQFTVNSVPCNKLHCQEGCGSDVKVNIIVQCHNNFMNNRTSPWQLKLVIFEFKFFVSAVLTEYLLKWYQLFCV